MFSTISSAPSPLVIAIIDETAPKINIKNPVRFTASDLAMSPMIKINAPTIGRIIGKWLTTK
jgi:hypothetical protein